MIAPYASAIARSYLTSRELFPFSLELESGPVIRRSPARLLEHLDLGKAERGSGRHPALHGCVEGSHELGGRHIGHVPQAGNNAASSRIHKATSQSNQSFARDLFAQAGFACTEHNQVG